MHPHRTAKIGWHISQYSVLGLGRNPQEFSGILQEYVGDNKALLTDVTLPATRHSHFIYFCTIRNIILNILIRACSGSKLQRSCHNILPKYSVLVSIASSFTYQGTIYGQKFVATSNWNCCPTGPIFNPFPFLLSTSKQLHVLQRLRVLSSLHIPSHLCVLSSLHVPSRLHGTGGGIRPRPQAL